MSPRGQEGSPNITSQNSNQKVLDTCVHVCLCVCVCVSVCVRAHVQCLELDHSSEVLGLFTI